MHGGQTRNVRWVWITSGLTLNPLNLSILVISCNSCKQHNACMLGLALTFIDINSPPVIYPLRDHSGISLRQHCSTSVTPGGFDQYWCELIIQRSRYVNITATCCMCLTTILHVATCLVPSTGACYHATHS